MASIYTDEERETRYIRLRKKKRICDRIFDICMIAALLFGLLSVGDTGQILMGGLGSINFGMILLGLFGLLVIAGVVIAVYKKDWRITAAELVLLLLGGYSMALTEISVFMLGVITFITLIGDVLWHRLSEQEGFPTFEIGYMEEKERQKAMQRYAENRAVAAGVRAEPAAPDDVMHDLLDADTDVQSVTQKLSGQHDRYRDAQAVEHGREQYVPGVMDTLEASAGHRNAHDEIDDILDSM